MRVQSVSCCNSQTSYPQTPYNLKRKIQHFFKIHRWLAQVKSWRKIIWICPSYILNLLCKIFHPCRSVPSVNLWTWWEFAIYYYEFLKEIMRIKCHWNDQKQNFTHNHPTVKIHDHRWLLDKMIWYFQLCIRSLPLIVDICYFEGVWVQMLWPRLLLNLLPISWWCWWNLWEFYADIFVR